jgi:outer membrane protein
MNHTLQAIQALTATFFVFAVTAAQAAPISLRESLTEALSNNPLLAEGRLGVEARDQGVKSAFGRHLPRLTLDASYTKRQDPLPFIPAQAATIGPHFSDEFAAWQATLILPLYQGGQIESGVRLAEVRRAIQEENLTLTRFEVIANTVNTYNKLLQLGKLREASQASVDALAEEARNAELLLDLGRIARVDLLKVEVQLSNERQRLATLDEGIATARETLAFLMGRRVGAGGSGLEPEGELLFSPLAADFDRGLAAARERRSEYLIARQGVEEAEATARITKGKLLPALAAFGGYLDQYGFDPSHEEANWFSGLGASVPLFDRSLYADLARDRILRERAAAHLVSVENQIRLDLRTAIASLAESKSRVESSREAVEQAAESFRIEQEKYDSGAGAMVDLLLAQAADFTAAANHAQALFDYNAAQVAWRKAAGTLEEYLQ